MRIVVLLVVWLTCTVGSSPWAEAQHGKFPERGSPAAWKKASAIYNKAIYLRRHGKTLASLPLYDECIRIYPFDSDFYMNAAMAYSKNPKTLGRAETLIKKGIELEDTAYDLQSEYSVILVKMGRFVESRDLLQGTMDLVVTPEQSKVRVLKLKELDDLIECQKLKQQKQRALH